MSSSSLRQPAVWVTAVALAALVWFARAVPSAALLAERLGAPLVLSLLTLLASLGWGALPRILRSGAVAEPRRMILAREVIVGLPLFGTVVFLVGIFSTSAPVMTAVLLLSALPGAVAIVRTAAPQVPALEQSRAVHVLLLLAGIAFLEVFAVAQLPAISLDELAYHLTVPMTAVLEGRIVELPLLSHSYFPFGSETPSLPALAILGHRGAIASHFVSMAIAIAVLLFTFCVVERRAGSRAAAVTTAALMTTPAMFATAGWTWADWPLLGAVLVMFDALERDDVPAGELALAIAAGLLTKYTFVVPAAALLVARVIVTRRLERSVLRGVLAGGVAGSFFFVRNLFLTGNPFAPFLDDASPDVTMFRGGTGMLQTIAGYVFDPAMQDEALGVALLLLLLAGLAGVRSASPRQRAFLVVSLAATLLLALLLPSARILVPAIALGAVVGATAFFRTVGGRAASACAAVVLTLCAVQLYAGVIYLDALGAFGVAGGHTSEKTYLRATAPYQEAQWANERLPENSKTLVVGLNALFWFDRNVRGGGNFDGPRINRYLEQSDTTALYQRMRAEGFTHVAIFERGLRVTEPRHRERATVLTQKASANLRTLLHEHTRPVASEGGRHLFALN